MSVRITAGDVQCENPFFVFDKDGLMFQSQPFWKALGEERLQLLGAHLSPALCAKWAKLFGFDCKDGEIAHTDPLGVFAVAAPAEEMAITAGFFMEHAGYVWTDAIAQAKRIFAEADARLDLRKALVPQPGFPDILSRLRAAKIPYAIATSDTAARAEKSLSLFGETRPELVITPESVKNQKPAPDMLRLVAKTAGVSIERIVMVGDSCVDTEMAKNAGAIGIGIPETDEMRRRMAKSAAAILDSLSEIQINDSNGGRK